MRHRGRTLLAWLEPFLHLAHLGALQVPEFDRHQLARRTDRGTRVEELGVTVAGDHLRGGNRSQPECVADVSFDLGRDVRVRAHRTAQLHHRDVVAGRPQARAVAVDLQCPEGDLRAERGRLGVDAVGPADHHRVAVLVGDAHQRGEQLGRRLDQQIGGVTKRPAQRGVDHVGRREPVVDPRRRRRPDRCLDHVDEGGDVVVGDGLAVEHLLHERLVGRRRQFATRHRVGCGDEPQRRMTLGREQFHLEPPTEPDRVGPDGVHLRGGIARDHDAQTR